MGNLIVCESVVAIVTHLRDTDAVPPHYGGHWPRPLALCGASVAWDTKLRVSSATCRVCVERKAPHHG